LALSSLNFKKHLENIKTIVVISGLFNSIVAIIQAFAFIYFKVKILNIYGWKWPDGFRVTGTSFDANHLAAFILLPLFISIDRSIKIKGYARFTYIFLTGVFLLTFYYSASRSGLIALFVGLLIYTAYHFVSNKIFKTLTYTGLAFIPVIFLAVALFFTPLMNLNKNQQLGNTNDAIFNATKFISKHGRGLDPSAFAHFALIHTSFYLQSENMFLGVGAGNFAEGLKQNKKASNIFLQIDPDVYSKDDFPSHSMYGEALAENGFVGLVMFCLLLVAIVKKYFVTLTKSAQVLPFFVYTYSMLFFMLFYNINEEFFWFFAFLGL
jgi:O-antigen ligase